GLHVALPYRTETRGVVVHHTGGEGGGKQVHRVLRNRGLSVQFFVDHEGVIWQYADANARAQHAGVTANGWTCGIEIQNRANASPLQNGIRREVVIDSVHGVEAKRTTFLPEQVASTLALVSALCHWYGLPMVVPMDGQRVRDGALTRAELASFRGVLGHFHVTKRKIDPGLAIMRAIAAHPIRSSREVVA